MKKLSVAVAVCAVLASSYASAEVRINGFASIVGGKSLDTAMMTISLLKMRVNSLYNYLQTYMKS